MDIREAKKEDASQINKLVTQLSTIYLHAEKDSLPDWLSSSLTIIEFENRINSNEFTNLVFENNGNIIGYISIKNTHHIYHLFVSQEHQRKGIAKKLWNNSRMLCPSKTYTVRSSLHAIPAYESFGFSKHSLIEIKDNVQYQSMEFKTIFNMNKQFAHTFSLAWLEAWNSHDLDKVLSHYSDDFEMSSPVIKQITNEKSGILKGKKAIRAYWEKALKMNPELHFEIITSFFGANSVVIHYKGHRGLSAETFFFNNEEKVISAHAHYE